MRKTPFACYDTCCSGGAVVGQQLLLIDLRSLVCCNNPAAILACCGHSAVHLATVQGAAAASQAAWVAQCLDCHLPLHAAAASSAATGCCRSGETCVIYESFNAFDVWLDQHSNSVNHS